MSADLLPCPFCGGAVKLERATDTYEEIYGQRKWWGVVCRNTINLGGTCCIQQVPSASENAAVERWNRRALSAQAAAPVDERAYDVDLCAFENAIRNLEYIERGVYPSKDHDLDGTFDKATINNAKKLSRAVLPRLRAEYTKFVAAIRNERRAALAHPVAVDALSGDAADAARWRAFIGSARIKPQGNAGLSDPQPNHYAHMGLEIWTTFDRDYSQELLDSMDRNTALGRDWLTRYADIAIAAQDKEGGPYATRPALSLEAAMKLAKQSYAYTSSELMTAPSITMTAGNLVRFFELASKEYKP